MEEKKRKSLYNPLSNDFTYELFNDDNEAVSYTIHSLEIEFYESPVYDLLKKHLIDAISNDRELGLYDMEGLAQIKKEIEAYE